MFHEEKGIAVCGLACVLCSESSCPGCQKKNCDDLKQCSVYRCASGKDFIGCYQCDDFPCGEEILNSPKARAFNRYAKENGVGKLFARLRENFDSGIVYHRADGLKGDYDSLEGEEQVLCLIEFGQGVNPYDHCPTLETNHFRLRLVHETDAEDLLMCYSDPKVQCIINSDNCTNDFKYSTVNEMLECIRFWHKEYESGGFIRWSIVDKDSGRAIGTMEMFCKDEKLGVLRVDVTSSSENRVLLRGLFSLATKHFYTLFNVDSMVTKPLLRQPREFLC